MAFIAVAICAMLLSGCVATGDQNGVAKNAVPSVGTGNNQSKNQSSSVDVSADSKNGYEKTKQAIQTALSDGTYSNAITYASPGGQDSTNITVTISNGVISDVTLSPIKAGEVSTNYINNYDRNIKPLVIGKKISEIKLPANVAGSSLTNEAFKSYLQKLGSF